MTAESAKPALRQARRADLDRLFEIRNAVDENTQDDPYEVFVEIGGHCIDQGLVWVWEEDRRILGFVAAEPESSFVEVLYVDPAAQGRGIGRALLARCCDHLRAAGHDSATLYTRAGTRAEGFYRALGWTQHGVTDAGHPLFHKTLS